MIELPTRPPAVEGLPKDHRGYPVPAESGWAGGVPDLGIQDPQRFFLLHAAHRCAICGFPFRPNEVRYRPFADVDARNAKQAGGARRSDGPGHLECMLFSVAVCPFFATASARAAHSEHRGLARGRKAAVLGFREVQMVLGRDEGGEVRHVEFFYGGLCDEVWFVTSQQVIPQLETAIDTASPIDMSHRLYWSDDVDVVPDWTTAVRRFNQIQPLK